MVSRLTQQEEDADEGYARVEERQMIVSYIWNMSKGLVAFGTNSGTDESLDENLLMNDCVLALSESKMADITIEMPIMQNAMRKSRRLVSMILDLMPFL